MIIEAEIPINMLNSINRLHDKLKKYDFFVSLMHSSGLPNYNDINALVTRSAGLIEIELAIDGRYSDTKPITAYIRKLTELLKSLELLEKPKY